MIDLVPYWVTVCRLLGVDPTTVPMPQVVMTPHEGPVYLDVINSIYLPQDKPVRVGQLNHELAHAVMCHEFDMDHDQQESMAQWVDTQTEDAQEIIIET